MMHYVFDHGCWPATALIRGVEARVSNLALWAVLHLPLDRELRAPRFVSKTTVSVLELIRIGPQTDSFD